MGKADYLKLGEWNAICDRCSQKRKSSDLKKTWNNLMVCADTCWEPKHPSDFYRLPPDRQSIPWARPEQTDSSGTDVNGNSTIYLGGVVSVPDTDKTLTMNVDPTTQDWSTDLTANRTITLSVTNAQQGDRFKIYRTAVGAFTLDISGLKTGLASEKFMAEVEYNGTSWLLVHYTPLGI